MAIPASRERALGSRACRAALPAARSRRASSSPPASSSSEVLQSAARRLSAALEIPDCDIYRLEEGERLVCLASTVDGVFDASWVGQELRLDDWPCDRLAVETRRAVTVSSLDDPRLGEAEREEHAPLRPAQLHRAALDGPRQGHRPGRPARPRRARVHEPRRSPPPKRSASWWPWPSSTPNSTRRSSTSTWATCAP